MVQIITGRGGGGVGLYKYKGSVDYYEDLPTSGMKAGDTYNVVNAFTKDGKGYPAGTNVAWTGTEWDPLGGSIDLSDYQKKLVEGDGIDLDQDTNEISVESAVISGAEKGATAIQPGDNVSELVNDAGYITDAYHDDTKQDKLIAGANIQIAADGKTISATDTTYTAGQGIDITNNVVKTTFNYGTSDTAAATVEKVVSIPTITELNVGQVIIVQPSVTSTVANSTLKLNNFTAYPMRYNNAAISTSTDSIVWGAAFPSMFIFDGTYWVFLGHGLDSNTTYTINYSIDAGRYQAGTGTYAITRYSLVMMKPDGTWEKITDTTKTYTTATTKTVNTRGFVLGQIRFYNTTTAVANGAFAATNTMYNKVASVNTAYSFNCGTAPGWNIGDYIYLVGSIGNDGLFYLNTTQWWSNVLPSTNDGKLYIRLGIALTDTDATMSFLEDRPIFYYDNGLKIYVQADNKQDTISDLATIRSGAGLGATAVQPGDLATVATTGKYCDLTGQPTIGNATLTIQRNGTCVNSITMNATSNVTADISVPTKTSDISNDCGYINKDVANLTNYTPTTSLCAVATSGKYCDLSGTPDLSGYQTKDCMVCSLSGADDSHYPTAKTVADALSCAGAGDMIKTVYDPNNCNADAFDYNNFYNKPSIIDNLCCTSTTDALSANQGKALKDLIDTYVGLGRFLSLWNASTGQPISFPLATPYTYKTGDWYMVEITGTTNYMPNGSSYSGSASTTVDSTNNVEVRDVYIYDGTDRLFQKNNEVQVSFADIAGVPADNSCLNAALNAKANTNSLCTVATSGKYCDLTGTPSLCTVATSGKYCDLTGTPNLCTVATSGKYCDLTGTPTIPTNNSQLANGCGYVTASVNNLSNYTLSSCLCSVATSGEYCDLANTPTIPTCVSQLSNDSGFITGITCGDVTTALGYTPYSSANPSGYTTCTGTLSSCSDVISALGYTPYSNANPSGYTTCTGTVVASDLTPYAKSCTLCTVATSGKYCDLTGKPTIPTDNCQLANSCGFTTCTGTLVASDLNGYATTASLCTVATSGKYCDLTGLPTIPTNNNQLTNGCGYTTCTGTISTCSQIISTLGYTPYNSTNPNGYTTCTGTLSATNTGSNGQVLTKTSSGATWCDASGGINNDTIGTTTTVTKIWAGTQTEYTNLGTKDASTIYFTF